MTNKYFNVDQETLKHIAQSLLEGKKVARSMESAANSLRYLTIDEKTKDALGVVETYGRDSAKTFEEVYAMIANDAFKKGDSPDED